MSRRPRIGTALLAHVLSVVSLATPPHGALPLNVWMLEDPDLHGHREALSLLTTLPA